MKGAVTHPKSDFPTLKTFSLVPHNKSSGKVGHSSSNSIDPHSDEEVKSWYDQFHQKYGCIQHGQGAFYHYHVRKAAGTTVRDLLQQASRRFHIPYYESEGMVLDPGFLKLPGLLTVMSLRDPIERIVSLYWYEHVAWYYTIVHQPEKCHTFQSWVAGWRDGSSWKRSFQARNHGSVYLEIENYYIKMLIGGGTAHESSASSSSSSEKKLPEKITRIHLEEAKKILASFDLILLKEWINDQSQIDALHAFVPGRGQIALGHAVRGDSTLKERWKAKLAANEVRH